jgi:hypothetical protein
MAEQNRQETGWEWETAAIRQLIANFARARTPRALSITFLEWPSP